MWDKHFKRGETNQGMWFTHELDQQLVRTDLLELAFWVLGVRFGKKRACFEKYFNKEENYTGVDGWI